MRAGRGRPSQVMARASAMAWEATLTILAGALERRVSSNRLVSKNQPRWLTARFISMPSPVIRRSATCAPALLTKTWRAW